jgi:hypothetical protein
VASFFQLQIPLGRESQMNHATAGGMGDGVGTPDRIELLWRVRAIGENSQKVPSELRYVMEAVGTCIRFPDLS